VLPVGPPNHLGMFHDYIEPSERPVACPNQDVVYGQCVLALDREPVVVQVPDFGDRFWVYQIVDQRADGFATIGKMYGTKPGFYLLADCGWNKGTQSNWLPAPSGEFSLYVRSYWPEAAICEGRRTPTAVAKVGLLSKLAGYGRPKAALRFDLSGGSP
jgi:hypothetical protein